MASHLRLYLHPACPHFPIATRLRQPRLSRRSLRWSFVDPCSQTPSVIQSARRFTCISRSNDSAEPLLSQPHTGALPSFSVRSEQDELTAALSVIVASRVPTEEAVLESLKRCERLAKSGEDGKESPKKSKEVARKSTSNLLARSSHLKHKVQLERSTLGASDQWRDDILDVANQIVMDEKTFLTSKILRTYVNIVSILGRPQNLPYVFDLYAAKPVPRAASTPVVYKYPNPLSHTAAVPLDVARMALEAAIAVRDLPLCLNVVTTSVATRAFRRNKILRKASIPALTFAFTPWASYGMAKLYTDLSPRSDPDYAFYLSNLAFMTFFTTTAMMMYIGFTIQFQKVRVTWRAGTALYERWTREEERAFIDEIAQAWGFQDSLKRGEEQGREWSNLRKWIMDRSMDLDRPDWMEGME